MFKGIKFYEMKKIYIMIYFELKVIFIFVNYKVILNINIGLKLIIICVFFV